MTSTQNVPHTEPKLNVRPGLILTVIVAAAMAVFSAWAWTQLPESVPVHFGLDGKPDRMGHKSEVLFLLPATALGLGLLLAFLPSIEPRRGNLAQSAPFYYAAWTGALALQAGVHVMIIAAAMGVEWDFARWILTGISALFLLLGNFMSKTRPNFFAGIRTPWTLSSDHSWEKTHRLSGWLFVAAGLLGILLTWTAPLTWAVGALLAAILVGAIVPMVASYFYWRDDPERAR